MSGLVPRGPCPAPGQAPLVAPNAAALLRRNAEEFGDRTAIRFGDRTWTHARVLRRVVPVRGALPRAAARRRAAATSRCCSTTPPTTCSRSAAPRSIGAAIVGLNHTRRGEHLLRDVAAHALRPGASPSRATTALLAPIADRAAAGARRRPVRRRRRCRRPRSARRSTTRSPRTRRDDPGLEPDVDSIWALIFTSGTSDAPKAVICSQRRLLVTGNRMAMIMDLGPDDIGYVCMPLFHSNAVQVGWAPSIVDAVRRSGSAGGSRASGWLADVRHYGATYFNYTGKPLAYLLAQPEQRRRRRQPAAGRVRQRGIARGRRRVRAPLRRRGDRRVRRDRGRCRGQPRRRRCAPGALGRSRPTTCRSSTTTATRSRAREFDDRRPRSSNAEECVGEIVNTAGRRAVRGLLQQRRRDREDDALRLVLVGRPRLQGRRRLPLLRRPQRRLDPGRRRELPGRPDRGGAAQGARRRARRGLRRARRPGRRPGDGRPRAAPTARRSTRRRSRAGSTRRTRSARSGGRATCASCATRRPPAPTRS